jgi:hypothetical protein
LTTSCKIGADPKIGNNICDYVQYNVKMYATVKLHILEEKNFCFCVTERDPESNTSGSVATGRASLAGQVKG